MTSTTIRCFCIFVVAVLSATVAAAAPALFHVGGAGDLFPTPPAGYTLAKLADVQEGKFFTDYNANGLVDLGETVPADACHVIVVKEGVLVYGTLYTYRVISPYGTFKTFQNSTQLVNPVWFGAWPIDGKSQVFYGSQASDFFLKLHTVPLSTALSGKCNARAYYGIYAKATFGLAGFGSGFPLPPSKGAALATVSDIQSPAFVEAYNRAGLSWASSGHTVKSACCAIGVNGGYLLINRFGVQPYTQRGASQCPLSGSELTTPVWFGTQKGFVGQLNATAVTWLKASTALPSWCSATDVNTFGLYKIPYTATPVPPPHAPGCIKADLRATFDVPFSVSPCLADNWRTVLKLNGVYTNIPLDDFNDCKDRIAANINLKQHNTTHFIANTTGASGCECSDWSYVPYKHTSESTTVCHKTIKTFGFCEVLIDVKKTVECP